MKHAERTHQRIYLTFYLRVFEDDAFLGFMTDVSREGLMLMSEFPLEEEREYTLRMKIPSCAKCKFHLDDQEFIEFRAICRWSQPEGESRDFFLNGFQIVEITEEENQCIHYLIEEFKIK